MARKDNGGIIEIQTIEGGRLTWVGIMRSSDTDAVIEWGDALLAGFHNRGIGNLKPSLRITDYKGVVIGAWQSEGFVGRTGEHDVLGLVGMTIAGRIYERINDPDTEAHTMSTKAEASPEYSVSDLLEVANAARPDVWRLKEHPTKDALTIYSRHGYVIHPALGFVNDDNDARFIATFDPPTVRRLLERLAALGD